MLAEPAFVGREQELAQLEHHLKLAIEGKGSTIFVSGEAGTGKTRLTTEFLNRAKKQGATVLTGWCLSNAAVPYFPFFEAFSAYFTREPSQETEGAIDVTSWLKGPSQADKAGKPQTFSPQVWKDQTFAAVAKTLATISAGKPIILFIDDVHWADSASLALIHYIARAISCERILLLATFRSEQLAPDTEGRPHPLVETLRLIRREDLFKEIKLSSLSQTGVSELAKGMLDGDLQQQFAEKLTEESQGNPLFVVESLRMLHERNGLIRDRDQWRLTSDEIGIPVKIKDIVLQRLGALSRNQRRVLEAASVIGEKFSIELLASLLSQDSLEVIETLDVVQKDTSLVLSEGELYRFDHGRSRDAIYDEISIGLKRGYHSKLAEKLESTSEKGKLALSEIAHHYAQAGNKEKAAKYALAAGQDALSRWSNIEAMKHFSYVVQVVGEDHEWVEERCSALEGLGDAFRANSMFKEAARTYENLANNTEKDKVRLRAFRKAMDSAFQYSDFAYLMELVKKAEPYAAADRLENARVLFSRARAFHLQSKFPEAIRDMEVAMQVFEEEYSLWDIAANLIGLGGHHAARGMLKEGRAESLRSVALFEELEDFREEMEAGWVAGMGLAREGLLHEALEVLAKVIEIDEKMRMGDYLRLVYANRYSSDCFVSMGNFKEALLYSLKALELSKKTDSLMAHGVVYSSLTQLYTILGEMKQAEEYFKKLMKLPPEILFHGLLFGKLAMAIYFAGKHQWDESNKVFREFRERSLNLGRAGPGAGLGVELYARRLQVWSLEKQGCHEEARIQLEECQRIRRQVDESFEHADLQAHLMIRRQAVVGEEREMRLDLVNIGRKPALIVKIENVLPDGFKVAGLPSWCSLENGNIEMKNREIGAFQVESVKLILKSLKAGTFTLNPQAVYVDDLGKTQTCNLQPVTIIADLPAAQERVEGKLSSGFPDLDRLLLGGIPENYAVILTSPSSDERELLIKKFLTAGAKNGETVFYVTTETSNGKFLAEQFPSNFYLFVCNPQADTVIPNLPNVFKLKGVESLTEIDIALTKAFRSLNPAEVGARRACIEIVSDVLLQHRVVTTRKWLSGLLPSLKSKGFTTLAVIDPQMHPQEELQAILGLFEGELRVTEKETAKGPEKTLRVRKLYNQKYLENVLPLLKEKLDA